MAQTLIVPRHVAVANAAPKNRCGDCEHLHAEGGVNEFVCIESPPQVTVLLTPLPPPHIGQLRPQPFACYPPRTRESLGCARFKPKIMQ
jgi:hypothetical protein